MKNPTRILVLLAFALLAGSCSAAKCHCRAYQKKYRRPLTGTTWQLVQLNGRSVQAEEGKFLLTLSAEEGRLAGVGACNRLAGKFETDKSRALTFGPIVSTYMACPDLEREHEFIRALRSTTHYDMDGPVLILLSDGEMRALLQAVPEPGRGEKTEPGRGAKAEQTAAE